MKKIYTFLGVTLISGGVLFSQGDDCASAVEITPEDGSCTSPGYDNTGLTSSGDPSPACWADTPDNSAWFFFTATAEQVSINTNFSTFPGDITDTQLALFEGSCGSLTELDCNEDIMPGSNSMAALTYYGLTIGDTYYVMVDGASGQTGPFNMCIENLADPTPPTAGQDCDLAAPLCSGDPISYASVSGFGTDEAPTCFSFGEGNSTWVTFTAETTTDIAFTITPNSNDDYDFAFYDLGPSPGTCGGTELVCEYSTPCSGNPNNDLYSIGLSLNPAGEDCSPGFQNAETPIAGNTYAILISNFAATDGFVLEFTSGDIMGPTADFTAVPTTICVGESVAFTNSSTGPNSMTYNWDFGDGSSPSSETNPDYAFTSSGSFTTTLSVIDDVIGCVSTATETITVNAGPIASFTSDAPACVNETVTFTNTSTGATSYEWDYTSDNVIDATTTNGTNTFASGGTIYTTLIATDGSGCTDTVFNAVTINALPTVSAGADQEECEGTSVTLSGSGASSYSWNLGVTDGVAFTPAVGTTTYTVTGTDANGCENTATVDVTINANPVPSITPDGPVTFCDGGSVGLDAGAFTSYAWTPNSEISQTVTASASGTYEVTVTDANGCQGTDNVVVTVNANPTPAITPSGPTSFCDGGSVDLIADGGFSSYAWTPNSETTQTITALASGTYEVTVTDANGCTGTASEVVTENALPTPSISPDGPLTFCDGGTVNLDAGAYVSYSWNTTETTQAIDVTTSGNYEVTVTDANGCTGTDDVTVTVNALPTPTIAGATQYCAGASTTLDAGFGYSSYSWSTGDNAQFITATIADNDVTVTVTDANGCEGTSPDVTLTESSSLSPVISGDTEYCAGSTTTLNAGSGYVTYNWSTGATSQTIDATTADNSITVTVTDINGCTGTSAPLDLTENTLPTPVITGTLEYCAGDNTVLDAGVYASYSWSTSATTQTINATTADNSITVTVTDANGCVGTSAAVDVVENPLPTPVITGTHDYCAGDFTTLDAGAGYSSYTWSTADVTQTADVTIADNPISVTVSDGNGCIGTSATVVVTENALPTPTITGTLEYCQGFNTTLDAGAGYTTYLWSNSDVTQTTVVTTADNSITVTVTDANGCVGTSAAVDVVENANPTPAITPDGPTTFCDGGSVGLQADAGYVSYAWTPDGQTSDFITASASNTYEVTVTDANGCVGSVSEVVTVNANPIPTITPDDVTTFCDGGDVNLDAGAYISYAWTPNSETTQVINVTETGNYGVTVTDANGCIGTDNLIVTVNALPTPSITPDGPTTFCDGGSVGLDANAGYVSYAWTPNAETTQGITASAAGTYEVTVVDGNGCSNTASEVITVNANPTPAITPSGPTTFCDGGSVDLIADGGYATYDWTPNGEFVQTVTASTSGTYEVTVSDVNGCIGTASEVVTVNDLPTPSITPDGPTTFCDGGSVNLDAGAYTSYLWNTTETTQTINAASAGTYDVTVTDANGCSESTSVTISVNANPTATIAGSSTYCIGGSTSLDAGAGYTSYLWSTGDNTQTITATIADNDVTVTVTDANGCSDVSDPLTLAENAFLTPVVSGATEYCAGDVATLDAGAGYTTYTWSTGAATQSITATTVDNSITVTVTDANGCTGTSAPIDLTENANPAPVIAGATDYCEGSFSLLDAGAGFSTYTWSTGASTQTINGLASDNTISVTVIDANGCTGTSPGVDLTENTNPTPVITGGLNYCAGSSSTLDAGAGFTTYLWSNTGAAQTDNFTTVDNPISVTVTDANGCTGTSPSVVVTENALPAPSVSGLTDYCSGNTATLSITSTFDTYVWSNGGSTQSENFTTADNPISVTVTNTAGCSATSAPINLTELVTPTPVITGDLDICAGASTTLSTTTNYPNYNWSNSSSNATVMVTAGTYSVTVTSADGCEGTSPSVTVVQNALPDATITAVAPVCEEAPSFDMVSATPGGTWGGSGIVDVNNGTFNPSIGEGTYSISYSITDGNGCTGTDTEFLTVNPTPVVTISSFGPICEDELPNDMVASVSGGAWSGTGITDANNGTFDPASSGSGTFAVQYDYTDGNGCSNFDTYDVEVNALPDPSITTVDPACEDALDFDLIAASTGGTWSGLGIVDANAGTFSPSTVGAGSYIVNYDVTDVNGCSNSDSYEIQVLPLPDASFTSNSPYCQGDAADFLMATVPGGSYSGNGITDANFGTFDPITAGSGTHSITYAVTGPTGCASSETIDVIVNETPADPVAEDKVVCYNDDEVLLESTSGDSVMWYSDATLTDHIYTGSTLMTGETEPGTYTYYMVHSNEGCLSGVTSVSYIIHPMDLAMNVSATEGDSPFPIDFEAVSNTNGDIVWDFGNGDSSDVWNTTYVYEDGGSYTVTLTMTSDQGCTDSLTTDILIHDVSAVVFPDIFTPNGDGYNDLFNVESENLETISCSIYNRWGNLIYKWDTSLGGWDGRTLTGELAPDGTYYFIIETVGDDGVVRERRGDLMLIR